MKIILNRLTAILALALGLQASAPAQTVLGKHPADKLLPAFYTQNGNLATLIAAINGSPTVITNVSGGGGGTPLVAGFGTTVTGTTTNTVAVDTNVMTTKIATTNIITTAIATYATTGAVASATSATTATNAPLPLINSSGDMKLLAVAPTGALLGNNSPFIRNGSTLGGDASLLTNILYGSSFISTNGYFYASATNADGSRTWTYVATNINAGILSGTVADLRLSTNAFNQLTYSRLNQSGVRFLSPIGWEPHFYLGNAWTETNVWAVVDAAVGAGINRIQHGQYRCDMTHWQIVTNNWQYVPNPQMFPHGLQYTLDYCHSNGCLVVLYMDAGTPFGGDLWMTNSAGQYVGGFTNVIRNITNLLALYPSLNGTHYDDNATATAAEQYQNALIVDTTWLTYSTNNMVVFEHDTFPPETNDYRTLGSFPPGTLFGLLSDPDNHSTGSNAVFQNIVLATLDMSQKVGWMFPQNGRFIQPQELPYYPVGNSADPGITNGYAMSAYYNCAGICGWGLMISAGNGGIANYTAGSGPPATNAYYWTGTWATNQEYLAIHDDDYSACYLAVSNAQSQVWARELWDGSYAVLMLNRSLTNAQTFGFKFNQIGGVSSYWFPPPAVVVKDVFYGTNVVLNGALGFTNTLQPNYLGEPAKLYHVTMLYPRPVDATQLTGPINVPSTFTSTNGNNSVKNLDVISGGQITFSTGTAIDYDSGFGGELHIHTGGGALWLGYGGGIGQNFTTGSYVPYMWGRADGLHLFTNLCANTGIFSNSVSAPLVTATSGVFTNLSVKYVRAPIFDLSQANFLPNSSMGFGIQYTPSFGAAHFCVDPTPFALSGYTNLVCDYVVFITNTVATTLNGNFSLFAVTNSVGGGNAGGYRVDQNGLALACNTGTNVYHWPVTFTVPNYALTNMANLMVTAYNNGTTNFWLLTGSAITNRP